MDILEFPVFVSRHCPKALVTEARCADAMTAILTFIGSCILVIIFDQGAGRSIAATAINVKSNGQQTSLSDER